MAPSEQLEERGRVLIEQLKQQVLGALTLDEHGLPGGKGLGNAEIERFAGLEVPLDRPPNKKQEHWLTWTIIQRLAADGRVEPIRAPRTKYRLIGR